MDNNLTDRSFWKSFWESRKNLIFKLKANYIFGDILEDLITKNGIKNAVELGGFPGYYSIYLKIYKKIDTTLFDYFVHYGLIKELLEVNGLKEGDINIIEADLFNYKPEKLFDMVLSFGLIEHFNDTASIIETHLQFLKPGGVLFVTLPNFTGVNGWVQRTFDKENYYKHYIDCMNPEFLDEICQKLGLKNVECYFHGKFTVWLENKSEQSKIAKLIVRTIWVAGKAFNTIIPVKGKFLSPFIVLKATS